MSAATLEPPSSTKAQTTGRSETGPPASQVATSGQALAAQANGDNNSHLKIDRPEPGEAKENEVKKSILLPPECTASAAAAHEGPSAGRADELYEPAALQPNVISTDTTPTPSSSSSSLGLQPPISYAPLPGPPTAATPDGARVNGQWMMLAAQATSQGVRQRMALAGDQFGYSLRQLCASASSIAADVPPSYHNIPGIVPYYHGRASGPPPSYDDVVNPYAAPPTYQSLFGQMLEARKRSRGLVDLLRRLLIISTLSCTLLIAFMILIPFTMIIVGAIYLGDCRVEHIPAFLLVGGLVWASKNIIHCYVQCQRQAQQHPHLQPSPQLSARAPVDTQENEQQLSNNGQRPFEIPVDFGQLVGAATVTTSGANTQTEQVNENNRQQRCDITPNLGANESSRQRLKSSICESLLNCVLFGWFIVGCVIVFRNYEPDFENTSSPRYCNRTVYMYTFWLIASAILMFGLFISCICCLMVSSALASRQEDDLA